MVDQIADRREVFLPGPQGEPGPRGEQGLPGPGAVPADQAVAAYVAASGSATNGALQDLMGRRGRYDIFIGDSYTQAQGVSATDRWPAKFCAAEGTTELNFAVGGRGYTPSEDDFMTQLQRAKAKVDEMGIASRVRRVMIVGSRNDGNSAGLTRDQTYKTVRDAADAALAYAVSSFPRADIVVVPLLWSSGLSEHIGASNRLAAAEATFDAARILPGIHVIDNAWQWLAGRVGVVQDDGAHPNAAGHKIIAGAMRDAVTGYGGWTGGLRYQALGPSDDTWAGQMQVWQANGMSGYSGVLQLKKDIPLTSQIGLGVTIPNLALISPQNGNPIIGTSHLQRAISTAIIECDQGGRHLTFPALVVLDKKGTVNLTAWPSADGTRTSMPLTGTYPTGMLVNILPFAYPTIIGTANWAARAA